MGALVLACLVWLHTVVSGMRRRATCAFLRWAVDAVTDQLGAGA